MRIAILAMIAITAATPAVGADLPVTATADLRDGRTGLVAFRSLAFDGVTIVGTLTMPRRKPKGASKVAAMVIHHGSAGPRASREGRYARFLNRLGMATFVLDSFGPRKVRTTTRRQSQVRGIWMVGDAFTALKLLATHPGIDARRIGIIGFSKGGTVALNTAARQMNRQFLGASGLRFAVHIPLYPWCGLPFKTVRWTGGPILVLMGARDTYTGIAPCRRYVARLRAAGVDARLVAYPGAYHAFDHDGLTRVQHLRQAQNFSRCLAWRGDDLWLIDPATGRRMGTRVETRAFFQRCMTRGATIGPNPVARRQAMIDIERFVSARLLRKRAR